MQIPQKTDFSPGEPAQRKLGPIILAPGVLPRHAVAYLALALCMAGLIGFISAIQPYLFTEILHIPRAEQGKLTGALSSAQQASTLVLVALAGIFVDRLGRRPFLIAGAVGVTLVVILYPLIPSIGLLFTLKLLLGIAISAYAAGGATMVMDLPDNGSRGKFHVAFTYTMMLVSAVVIGMFAMRLPSWLAKSGLPASEVHFLVFWIMALFGLVALVLAVFFVKHDAPRDPGASRESLGDSFRNYGRVIAHARQHVGFRILMVTSFATRADGVVIQAFLILWIVNAGADQGISTPEAMLVYGNLQIMLTALHVIFPPMMGWLADRVDRVILLLGSMFLTAIAFCGVMLVDDVTSWTLFAVMAGITLVETIQNTSVQTLLGQEAPAELRGSAYGLYNLCGTFSVVLISLACGYLYDRLGYTAPFLMIAAFSLVFGVIATAIYLRYRAREERQVPGSEAISLLA